MAREIRLGIAGLGTVGANLVQLISQRAASIERDFDLRLVIAGISARDPAKHRGFDPAPFSWYSDPVQLARAKDIDIFVELIGGASGPAENAVKAAIAARHDVLTANKALLARSGALLASAAQSAGCEIAFEAAVAGGIPVIKSIKECLAGQKISKIYAILNGTCNYILTRMLEHDLSLEQALREAQHLGYAEADASADIEGFDAAHKLAILTALAFKQQLAFKNIFIRGISDVEAQDIRGAEHFGYRLKLLASCEEHENGIIQAVEPCLLPKNSSLAQTAGVVNGVTIISDLLGELFLSGPGAGGMATASALLADIIALAQKRGTNMRPAPLFGVPIGNLTAARKAERNRQLLPGFYIRLCVEDKAGVFADVSKKMARNDISFESIVQNLESLFPNPSEHKHIVIITHAATRHNVEKALKTIGEAGYLRQEPKLYPLLKL